MRTLGLIGGFSWISTVEYYTIINQQINQQLGELNAAKLFLYSYNYEEFKPTYEPGVWERIGTSLTDIAIKLQTAGAECIVLCANTPHMVAGVVQQHITIPLIHIADETSKEITKQKLTKVALLGTRFTMEETFFTDRLSAAGITAIIPNKEDRDYIHATVFNELGKGIFTKEIKDKYLDIIDKLILQGAEAVIFGCTEIPLLIPEKECSVPVFNTTLIHAKAAVAFALQQ